MSFLFRKEILKKILKKKIIVVMLNLNVLDNQSYQNKYDKKRYSLQLKFIIRELKFMYSIDCLLY